MPFFPHTADLNDSRRGVPWGEANGTMTPPGAG
jgi:hypothetical protein